MELDWNQIIHDSLIQIFQYIIAPNLDTIIAFVCKAFAGFITLLIIKELSFQVYIMFGYTRRQAKSKSNRLVQICDGVSSCKDLLSK